MNIIKYNINNVDSFLNELINEQNNIYNIIDKENNTNYAEQLSNKDISIQDFFNIINFGKYVYYQFDINNNLGYQRMIPFTIVKDNNNVYVIYSISESSEESKQFIKQFFNVLTSIDYDISALKEMNTDEMAEAISSDKDVFIMNKQYYKYN